MSVVQPRSDRLLASMKRGWPFGTSRSADKSWRRDYAHTITGNPASQGAVNLKTSSSIWAKMILNSEADTQ